MTAAGYLAAHPEIPHGPVRIAFTPDEEVGRGTAHFDVARFGAACAYTMDGGSRGEVEAETFSADAITVTFHGFNTHPGYAKGRMVNAIKIAADFIGRLPFDRLSPETTDGREGFVHPYVVQAGVERTSVRLIVRDFDTAGLKDKEALVESLARAAVARWAGARFDAAVEEQYRNMKEMLDRHPDVVANAHEAVRRAGLAVRSPAIRGGTDGSRLSFMGLPTPNLFAGEHNFHSRLEWVSAQDMEKAVDVIVNLCRVWEERG
jgi:tripeptide aminopeptidase